MRTRMKRRRASNWTMPASSMASTNARAEPSMIGISAPSTSMMMLSTSRAAMAAITCSIVPMVAPLALPMTVQRSVATTLEDTARMSSRRPSEKTRRKTTPLSMSPGWRRTATSAPLWTPMPESETRCAMVVWLPEEIEIIKLPAAFRDRSRCGSIVCIPKGIHAVRTFVSPSLPVDAEDTGGAQTGKITDSFEVLQA
ncbi:exported hypothetical protein [Rhizobium sp. EC-SD404]|nr:exported hypothetical protein [Rhizobium sp. EC-SD404]